MHVWPLSIFLIRQDLKEDRQILGDLGELSPTITLRLPDGDPENLIEARLYFTPRGSDRPKWASFFGDLLSMVVLPRVSSVPAILLVPIEDRLMAVAFSHGSSLMEPGTFDPTFGLRVALNSVKPGKVRSYDKRTFDALFRQTREQAANETKLENFGIDAERDLVRKVAGKPENEALGTLMTGGASLHVSVRMTPDLMVDYLRRLYNKSRLIDFRDEYPWLGRIEEVLDEEIKETLDSYLDDRIRGGAENVWLAVPKIIEWSGSGFRFVLPNRSSMIYPELTLESLCRACNGYEYVLDIGFFRDHRVEMLDGNDLVIHQWRLYDCLNAELAIGSESYVLSSGSWYRVDSNLVKEIDREIEQMEIADLPLPKYELDDEDEYFYNCRVGSSLPERFCCLDTQTIMFGGDKNRFELCDLFESSGALIHVKRYGGSSALSHLFAQGLISAELLMRRPDFRENADKLVEKATFANPKAFKSKTPRDVVYVVIGGPANAPRRQLPLFSRINLRNAARGIRAYDWGVKIQYVPETELRIKHSRKKRSGRTRAAPSLGKKAVKPRS